MFEFTTLTVYNSVIKAEVADIRDGSATKGYNLIVGGDPENPEVRIGNTRFNKADVLDILKKVHTVENLAKVEFDIEQLITLVTASDQDVQAGDYRIALYLGLSMNSQDSFYSNALLYKGKPFYVEFKITASDTAEAVAKRIKKVATKFMLFMAQEKILNVTVDEAKVAFEGVNGYQLIKKAVILKFDPEAVSLGCCNAHGEYVDIIVGVPLTWTTDGTGAVTCTENTFDEDGVRELADNEVGIEPGIEAFCDYNWLIHNLRLPTLANTNFWAITKNEMPVVGGVYNQYIIRLCKERDGIAGEVVGQRATSVTTHVLYVLDSGSNVSLIETELAKLVTAMKTDADDVLADPFANAPEAETEEDQGGGGGQ